MFGKQIMFRRVIMTDIYPGRYTAVTEDPFVVFLIGMRINKLRAVHKWLPVARAMSPMMQTLFENPAKGFLGGYGFSSGRTTLSLQYWRSFEDLEAFARNPSDPHLSAWKRFNQAVGGDGTVGIWHETYMVDPNQYECFYGNMPRFGLGGVMDHVEAKGGHHTARKRLNKQPQLIPVEN
jgi:hypothetical protein